MRRAITTQQYGACPKHPSRALVSAPEGARHNVNHAQLSIAMLHGPLCVQGGLPDCCAWDFHRSHTKALCRSPVMLGSIKAFHESRDERRG